MYTYSDTMVVVSNAAYDGNGNILTLVNSSDGSTVAEYEYSPFGECIKATGPMALGNKFRFSTKYTDDETGLIYYGYRYYDAKNGRWVGREPFGENGGINLYGYCENDIINKIDFLGLSPIAGLGPSAGQRLTGQPSQPSPYGASALSFGDNFFPDPNRDYSPAFARWYEIRFPNTTAYAKSELANRINTLMGTKYCKGQSVASQDAEPIRINGYNNVDGKYPIRGLTEDAFGDRRQSDEPYWWGSEQTQILGNYSIRIKDLNYQRNMNRVSWKAQVVVVDTLGVHPSNVQINAGETRLSPWFNYYLAETFLGPQRNVIIASWQIYGDVCCK